MKKIKNMSIDEARQAFSKFEVKHPRNDDFDMNGLQINQFSELFERANKEDFASLLYDLFNYGFMAGYKQSEADLKAQIDKHMWNDTQRSLLELVYYLPFGYDVQFHYYHYAYMLPENAISRLPKRIASPILQIRAEREEKELRKKAEREERQKFIDEALKQYEQQKK